MLAPIVLAGRGWPSGVGARIRSPPPTAAYGSKQQKSPSTEDARRNERSQHGQGGLWLKPGCLLSGADRGEEHWNE
jgi:hypothetical protein